MKTILLKFAGPLQSWGTRSHFETRHTDLYPSKSAVIGIIAASMGYRRNDDERINLLNNLDYSVRVDQEGRLLRDYHTAKKYKEDGSLERTYVTNRYYIEDAIFVVGLGHENDAFVEKIAEGLQTPYFQTYMGRRSLPLTADFFVGIYNTDVITSLKNYPWQARTAYKRLHSNRLSLYSDISLISDGTIPGTRKDYVISFSQNNRRFGFRSEAKIEVIVPRDIDSTEHDAFSVLGD